MMEHQQQHQHGRMFDSSSSLLSNSNMSIDMNKNNHNNNNNKYHVNYLKLLLFILIIQTFSNQMVVQSSSLHSINFYDYDDINYNRNDHYSIDDQNNEIDMNEYNRNKDLPDCENNDKSICGYMQINSFGLNRLQICNCKQNDCKLSWKSLLFDKHKIIKHGNDYYKFCEKISNDLSKNYCSDNQLAYVSYGKVDLVTGEKIHDKQEMKCRCNDDYLLKINHTMFEMNDASYIYGTEQICQKAPICSRKQFCSSITVSADTTIERKHCRCSLGKYCPKDLRMAYEEVKEEHGKLYNMRCI